MCIHTVLSYVHINSLWQVQNKCGAFRTRSSSKWNTFPRFCERGKTEKIMSRLLTQCTMRAIPPRRGPCRQNALAFETSPPDRLPVVLCRSTSWLARGTEAYAGVGWPVAVQAKGSAIWDRAQIKTPPKARYVLGSCLSMLRALAHRAWA